MIGGASENTSTTGTRGNWRSVRSVSRSVPANYRAPEEGTAVGAASAVAIVRPVYLR